MPPTNKTIDKMYDIAVDFCPPEKTKEFIEALHELVKIAVTEATEYMITGAPNA